MRIHSEKRGDVSVIHMSGQLKIGDGDVKLRETFRDLLAAGERRFVFDMVDVPWMDSSGVGEIMACHKRAIEQGGRIQLALRGRGHDVFTMMELQRVIEIHDDVDQALAAFRG